MSDEKVIGPFTEFWRCPVCRMGFATGPPATMTKPPRCGAHGEMEQVVAEGFAADINDINDREKP